jgi:hypothetical protein
MWQGAGVIVQVARAEGGAVRRERAERLDVGALEPAKHLAVVDERFVPPRWRHDPHRPVAPSRVIERHAREREADLLVNRLERAEIEPIVEGDVRRAEDPMERHGTPLRRNSVAPILRAQERCAQLETVEPEIPRLS